MAERPCPLLPATERRRPGRSMTPSCVRSRSGLGICASWTSVGPRSSTASVSKENSTPGYLRELDERRAAILDSISQQGKLDAGLKDAIDAADSKARLEDLYLPYRP